MIKPLILLAAIGLAQSQWVAHQDCASRNSHFLIPHEWDCGLFYHCDGGRKLLQPVSCPGSTEFSAELQVCTHSFSSRCNLPGQPPDSTTETTVGTTDCERFDNGCPVDFSINQLLPHETSCRGFYQCVHGNKVPRRCPRGTFFNMTAQVCDHIRNNDQSCEDDESWEVTTPESDISIEIEWNDVGCPVNYTIEWLLPHDYYCNKYYQCVFGQKVPRICAPGTVFNATSKRCDHPINVNCSLPGGIYVPPTTTEAIPTERPTPPPMDFDDNGCPTNHSITWLIPHPLNCSKFYYCVFGGLVEFNCSAGLHFNPVLQICDNPATAGCALGPCSGDNKPCSSEISDPGSNECNDDDDNCGNDPGNDDSDIDDPGNDDPGTGGPGTGGPGSEEGPGGPGSEEGPGGPGSEEGPGDNPGDCDVSEEDKKCQEQCNNLPWAHEQCDKFWVCDGNKAVIGTCSSGLYFNPSTSTCDFACNVNCDSGKVRVTPDSDGLKLYIPWNKLDNNARQLLKLIEN